MFRIDRIGDTAYFGFWHTLLQEGMFGALGGGQEKIGVLPHGFFDVPLHEFFLVQEGDILQLGHHKLSAVLSFGEGRLEAETKGLVLDVIKVEPFQTVPKTAKTEGVALKTVLDRLPFAFRPFKGNFAGNRAPKGLLGNFDRFGIELGDVGFDGRNFEFILKRFVGLHLEGIQEGTPKNGDAVFTTHETSCGKIEFAIASNAKLEKSKRIIG